MSLDLMPGIYHGALIEVVEAEGTGLVGDHAAGATVLTVAAGGFRTAGQCRVNGDTHAYVREDDSLTITPALLAAAEDGTPVESLTPDGSVETRKLAVIDLDMLGEEDDTGNEDANLPRAEIPGEWSGFYPLGTAAAGSIVNVEDTTYGYRVTGRPTDAPILDGASIDASTLDVTALPPVSDGNAPTAATTVTPIGGIGSMFYRWTEVANADPVTYRLYVRAGSSPAAPTLLATNLATDPSYELTESWAAVSGSTDPVRSTDRAWAGTYSVKFSRGAGTTLVLGRRSSFTSMLPGAGTYRVAARMWVDPGITGNAGLRLSGTGVGATQSVYTAVRSGWDEVAITFTWDGVGTANFDVVDVSVTAGALIYVDGLILTAGSGVVAYFDGDTPDTASIVYAWTGTPNASTSTKTSITLDTSYEVAAGVGLTSMAVRKLADGTAIVGDGSVTYHAIVTVEDADGPGPASADVTGIPAQVNTADINVNAITVGLLTANDVLADAIDATDFTGVTMTAPTIRTVASGRRTELSGPSNWLSFYSGSGSELLPGYMEADVSGTFARLVIAAPDTDTASKAAVNYRNMILMSEDVTDATATRESRTIALRTGHFYIEGAGGGLVHVDGTGSAPDIDLDSADVHNFVLWDGSIAAGTFRDAVDARADARAAALNTWATSWTPTWTAATTNPVLGNGTLVGRFSQVGKVVRFYIELTMGSTTTFGTGAWRFDLPVAEVTSRFACLGNAFDTSATDDWPLHLVRSSSDQLSVKCDSTTAGGPVRGVTGTIPFAWGTGDVFYVSGTYPAA